MPDHATLAKIHIARKQLGLSDDEYHDILQLRFKKGSAKDLTGVEAAQLLDRFKLAGWQPKKPTLVKNGRVATVRKNDNYRRIENGPGARQQRLVLALWNALGYEVKKLDARCKRQWNIDRFEWVTDHEILHVLITDLKARCEAAGIDPDQARQGQPKNG